MKTSCWILSALLLLASLPAAMAQEKPAANRQIELIPDETEQFRFEGDRRVNSLTSFPASVYRVDSPVRHDTPENMARQYLRENARTLGLRPDLSDLRPSITRETPGGYRIHFEQYMGAYRVYKSTITVSINREDRVVFVMNGYKVPYGGSPTEIASTLQKRVVSVSGAQALQRSKARLGITGETISDTTETVWYYNKGRFHLVQRTAFISTERQLGGWEVMTDAATGEILRIQDIAKYQHPKKTSGSVNGKGWVFDPDPVTSARSAYGQPGFVDNGDADSPELTAQLFERVLRDLTFDPASGKYYLKGPYAEIVDVEPPYTGLHQLDSSTFHFPRSQRAFEAVMCYYHIDKSMRYVNDTLGFALLPLPYAGGVRADPHGLNGENNAWAMWDGHIAFGSPPDATDNAEEACTILHELFHLMHDWVTAYGASQVEGLGDGCADYWGQSYSRSYHYFSPSDQQYNWWSVWGGLPNGSTPYWRVTDWPGHYPDALTGKIHTDGQMWSSSLMSIYDVIGRQVTDRLLLEALSMTDVNTSQQDAAFAFMQADKDLHGGAHLAVIVPVFSARGYLTKSVTARFDADITGGPSPLTVHFWNRSFATSGAAVSCQWDFNDDGAVETSGSDVTHTFTTPGLFTVRLIASDGTTSDTLRAVDHVSVNAGVFLWDYFFDPVNCSSPVIESELSKNGVVGRHSRNLRVPSSLLGYEAAFLSLGGDGQGYVGTSVDSALYRTLAEYLEHGGRLYIEGVEALRPEIRTLMPLLGIGDVLYFYPPGGVLPLIAGNSASICTGLQFTGTSIPEEQEYFVPGTNGVPAFTQTTNNRVIGMQYESTVGAKSFSLAYNLKNFKENSSASTRLEFLNRVSQWFALSRQPYAHRVQLLRQSRDTLQIAARVENTLAHPLKVVGILSNGSGAPIDSVFLKDDGLHGDSASADGLWGYQYIPKKDDTIHVSIRTNDQTTGTSIFMPDGAVFLFTRKPILGVSLAIINLGLLSGTESVRDTSFVILNAGFSDDGIHIRVDSGSVTPSSAITVHPTIFALPSKTSRVCSVAVNPGLLPRNTNLTSVIIVDSDSGFGQTHFEIPLRFRVVTGIAAGKPGLPAEYELEQNYPNPFNPTTTISYGLPSRSHVTLTVFNTLGQQVSLLQNGEQEAGYHDVKLDGTNLSSGVYFYRLRAGDFMATRRLLLLR
jgi:PKD repeat protein